MSKYTLSICEGDKKLVRVLDMNSENIATAIKESMLLVGLVDDTGELK